jgi:hypothetical protein
VRQTSSLPRRCAGLLAAALLLAAAPAAAQVATVEVTPERTQLRAGDRVRLTAVGKDAAGARVEAPVATWFAAPFDLAAVDSAGVLRVYQPGVITVGAVVGGKVGVTRLTAQPAPVDQLAIEPVRTPLAVGANAQMTALASARGTPQPRAAVAWTSLTPAIARVDEAGVVTAVAPGTARLQARSGSATATAEVRVRANPVARLTVTPAVSRARTGDVVRLSARALGAGGAVVADPAVRWTVSGGAATVHPDGAFVAEAPGTYVVTAISGDRVATASVAVSPRNAAREVQVVGRAPIKAYPTGEQWIVGNHAYLSTLSNRLLVYDISNPASPTLTDSVMVDASLINDVSTTPDGKIGVITREGASNRKNGIVFLDLADPAHPRVLSEYTETVSGGVHSAFIDGHYVYLTDDATSSLRVIDFRDPRAPREVARWQPREGDPVPHRGGGTSPGGLYLHDVQVKDGLAYLAYWRDGLIILDVGAGIAGGSPERPQPVSRINFDYHDLYGDNWLAGAHAVFRYKNYVFVGDEVFPALWGIAQQMGSRFAVRGIVHVVDVSDIRNPRKVAFYEVPEGGSHNVWVKDDVLSMGYYTGGGRILDVSGELRGDLYRQGREIARVWTGDVAGYVPNAPFAWGAQPHGDHIYFNDVNSGLWITRLGPPKFTGSTFEPGI